MTKKRYNKKGGVDNNNLLVHLNNMEESTPSQGSLHLSDLNVTHDSMASGLTTNESIDHGYFANANTHGQGQDQEITSSLTMSSMGGSRKRKRSKKGKKSKKTKKSKKSKKTRKNKKKSSSRKKRGGSSMDTSPTPAQEQISDMLDEFN